MENFDFLKTLKKWAWPIGIVVFLLLAYNYVNGIKRTNNKFEIDATTQTRACAAELSGYMAAFQEKFGVLNFAGSTLDKIVQDAVMGKFDTPNSDGTASGTMNGGLFIQAVAQAFPNVDGIMEIAAEISTWIGSRRESFDQCQIKVLSILNAWDTWRTSDMIRQQVTEALGYPDELLEYRFGEVVLHGQDAYDKMKALVLLKDATNAYQTGEAPVMGVPTPMP